MSNNNDGGPAFPNAEPMWDSATNTYTRHVIGGMTLRDYFAGQALSSFRLDPDADICSGHYDNLSEYAYRIADAMVQRKEETSE